MTLRTVLAAAAVLAFSAPAMAQEATQPEAPAYQPSPEEAAFNAQATAFDGRIQTMVGEIRTMLSDASTNGSQKRENLEAILAVYTPEINTFADQMQTFLTGVQARSTDPQEQAAIAEALASGPANVRRIPDQVRQGVADAIAHAETQAASATASGGQPVQAGDGAVAGSIPVQ